MMFSRILVNILIAAAVFFLPWWSALGIAAVSTLLFPFFIEIIFWGFILDALFGGALGIAAPATMLSIGIYALALLAKEFVYLPE